MNKFSEEKDISLMKLTKKKKKNPPDLGSEREKIHP